MPKPRKVLNETYGVRPPRTTDRGFPDSIGGIYFDELDLKSMKFKPKSLSKEQAAALWKAMKQNPRMRLEEFLKLIESL